jgi:hypothetical protein
MAGLDPAIQSSGLGLDARLKAGHDEDQMVISL